MNYLIPLCVILDLLNYCVLNKKYPLSIHHGLIIDIIKYLIFNKLGLGSGRVAKTLNSSYKPNPEILKLPTFSGMQRQNKGT